MDQENPFEQSSYSNSILSLRGDKAARQRRRMPQRVAADVEEQSQPTAGAAPKGKVPAAAAEPSTGFLSAGLHEENAAGLGAPSPYIVRALAKKPADRTPQEKEALKVRSRAEEKIIKGGGKVIDSIRDDLIAEERAPGIGRREAKAALNYYDESEKTLAAGGRAADGSKLDPIAPGGTTLSTSTTTAKQAGAAAPQAAPAAGQAAGAKAPETVPLPKDARPAIEVHGFAMRDMPDGTVRTASGLNARGSSNMRDFATREAALAFYGQPPPMPAAPAGPAPAAQPAPMAAQPAPAPAPVAAPAPAPTGAPPAGVELDANLPAGGPVPTVSSGSQTPAPQTAAAARTTSPTARLEMEGARTGAPAPGAELDSNLPGGPIPTVSTAAPAPVAAPAAAPVAAQPDLGGVPTSEIFAQVTGANPTPGQPNVGFGTGAGELWNRATADAIWNHKPKTTPQTVTNADYFGERKPFNPFDSNRPRYDQGTPKPVGFQEDSETLAVR